MSRETTLPHAWAELALAYGGVAALAKEIGVSTAALYRTSRGLVHATWEFRDRVASLAAVKRIPNPMKTHKLAASVVRDETKVLEQLLDLLGRQISENTRVPKTFLDRMSKRIGTEALIELAERDDVSRNVHIAVSKLLGL